MNRAHLQSVVLDACVQDIRAFKPGNVSIGFPMQDMNAEDFILSAQAILAPITEPGYTVGHRIELAIEATRSAVSCYTNLGIVLLFAPLMSALERLPDFQDSDSLQGALHTVLSELTLEDAQACYRAIRIADPGGLGSSHEEDVQSEPSLNLLEVMRLAAGWDNIAREYIEDYAGIVETGLNSLMRSKQQGEAEIWAITRCYLTFVANYPDTHVSRRHGVQLARTIQEEALELLDQWRVCRSAAEVWPEMLKLHHRWRDLKINPGTSADLVVASILMMRLLEANSYNGARH
jgi:triphosphoribosyl-dephospho-CoA synthase